MNKTKTIVFITGAFVSHDIWDEWKAYFTAKGYTTLAPSWPGKEASAEAPGNDVNFSKSNLNDIIAYYESVIMSMPQKPIVIGHSIGGLIVQSLVNRDLVAAGIAIHSTPPKGVFSFEWSFLKSIIKPLGLFPFSKTIYKMSFSDWKYTFTNGFDTEAQQKYYDRYCIAESRKILRDALFSAPKMDFNKHHPPLLLTTGSNDHIVPQSLVYENYIKYNKNHSVTHYQAFSNRSHLVLRQPGWQDVAEFILAWLEININEEA
ncbi:alpha/beta hydrolase [Flavobacterium sp. RHBU_3]|uniref:alpha/beta hydrolase n=1 Tax=Flavobacterium sp. RHBU_3 TaxID=3391184 RepID=UPI0039849638